jgi:AcrR family transcriptional regulator
MGIAERKQREKEARVAQIKNTAAGLFQRKGFEDTTMDEIAQLCEVSKASIYSYFKSKDDLYYSILEPEMTEFSKHIGKLTNNAQEPADQTIGEIFGKSFKHYDTNPEVYQLLWKSNISMLPANKLSRLENILRTNVSHLEKTVQRGIDQGIFRRVDPKVTSMILWALYMGVYHQQAKRIEGGRSDYRKATLDAALELVLGGLKKK